MMIYLAVVGLIGCKTSLQAQEQPAVIGTSEAQAHVELEQVVASALGEVQIMLAGDALMRTDRLIIERRKHQTIEAGVLDSRSKEFPQYFRLVIKNTNCILIHEQTGKRYPLKKARCRLFQTE